jgi:ATP-dependent exoDNAse (exonuclease V) beta subunit
LSAQAGLGARWRNPATGESLADLAHLLYSRELEQKEEAEENRLFYVAMTRAEEHLVLSFAKTKRPASKWSKMVADGLGVDLDTIDNRAVIHVPKPAAFPVMVLRTAVMPEPLAEPKRPVVEQEEALLLPRPSVTDQHDSTAPVTAIATFETCPRRYFLGRYLGWRDTPRVVGSQDETEVLQEPEEFGTPDAAEFGRQVHSLLAGGPAEGVHPEASELASRFQSSDLGQRAARGSRAEREFDFLMALEDVVLRGQIDLWFEEGEELVLVDYKTDDVGADAAWDRAQSYALQLRLYALALERFIGRLPDQAYVCLLRPDRAVPIQLEAPLLEAAVASVRTFRQAQSDLRFDLREGEHCFTCQFYRGLCPAGKAQVATAAARPSSFPAPS